MTKANFVSELQLYWQKICYLFGRTVDLVRGIFQHPGMLAKGDVVVTALILLIVAIFLVGGLIRFIGASWKSKGKALLTLVLTLLIVAVIFYFILLNYQIPTA